MDFDQINPDRIFDGGDLDCGSGLALLLREHISQLAVGGVLEMRSREPTVADDLPPWCRMTGHEYLGSVPAADCVRYFVQRGQPTVDEEQAFQDDKQRRGTTSGGSGLAPPVTSRARSTSAIFPSTLASPRASRKRTSIRRPWSTCWPPWQVR